MGTAGHPADRPGPGVNESGRTRPGNESSPPDYRQELRPGGSTVDPENWAGSIPQEYGISPRIRVGRSRWFNLLWLLPIGWFLLLVAVAVARELRTLQPVQDFIARYPGTHLTPTLEQDAGFPRWVAAQHFLNIFLFIFIVRSGWQILADHPRLYWTRHSTPGSEWFRFQEAVPPDPLWTAKQDSVTLPGYVGLPGVRHSIGLARWWHLGVDTIWLVNGIVFYILCFSTPHWRRLVPTSWDVFPNAASVLIQYLSLDWPAERGWVAYNGLQQLAYFVTVFIAAPLALVTGLGMSPALSTRFSFVSRRLSIQAARSLHFLVMIWFVAFIVMHTTLVATTDVLRNLNFMYLGRNSDDWGGLVLFAISMIVVVAAWVAASPFTLRHPRVVQRVGGTLIGPAERLLEDLDATPGAYTEADISPYFWHNGKYPHTDEFRRLQDDGFAAYRLDIHGLVANPVRLSLEDLHGLPYHEQITQHFCIQGWSGVAKWGGVSMSTILDIVRPTPEANWVVFYSFAPGADEGLYYDVHPIEQMNNHLTMLAYDMNGEPLSFGHGAPLRLRNEVQLGFKQVKWLQGIEFVADYREVGGGYGGYNQDHEFFGYRQAI
jgi:sulfoxide reductase catalytic subunit YedY